MTDLLKTPAALSAAMESLGAQLTRHGFMCATAESCTGGLLGASFTAIPGASAWFCGGVMAYANAVKTRLLGVDAALLREHGAVSQPCVLAMAENVCRLLCVDVGVSISGVAGPGGGTAEKPVGTVWLGFCVQGRVDALLLRPKDTGITREAIRGAAVRAAVQGLMERLRD